MTKKDQFTRLPEFARPKLYEIYLRPDLENFTFKGSETIHVEIIEETDYLQLSSNKLSITDVSIQLADKSVVEIPSERIELSEKWELLTLKLPQKLSPQTVLLNFSFVGGLNDGLTGFYRSSYKGENGETKYMATTQFESTYARKAFPCWDEPIYKAKFDITMEVNKELTALSNMNIVNEQHKKGEGTKVVKFAITPLMSTYLVAFIVGDLEYIETKSKAGIDVRVYTVKGKRERGFYGLELAAKALDWYSDWYAIKMPLSKCDLVAIPDFSMGAMENWGLVTFREMILLMDPAKSSTNIKTRIALVVAHELAHFWFGNLVTMKWWTDLWLKEGFASFMEYLFVSSNCPEFNIWLNFLRDEVSSGLSLDSLRNSHRIEVPIDNPNELDEIYDSITYSKSNSVNRMLCDYLSESVFREGLRSYLAKFQFNNAETTDLWQSLSEISGQDVATMMDTWTKQIGYPLVTVEQKLLEGDRREIFVKQERFLADGGVDELATIWKVPINITFSSNLNGPSRKILLTKKEETFILEGIKPDEWIKLNSQTSGFFRISYSEKMFSSLLPAFRGAEVPKMNVLDRFGIVSDLVALIRSGRAPAVRFLEFLNECSSHETECVVWNTIDEGLSLLKNVIQHVDDGGKLQGQFNQLVRKNLEPLAERLSWTSKDGEGSEDRLLRQLILSRMARVEHEPTIQMAISKFRDYVDKQVELDPDLRPVVFGILARTNDVRHLAELKKILETVNFNEIEANCISALGQVTDKPLLDEFYTYGVVDGKIRSQDLLYLFRGSSSSKVGQFHAWEFFKKNHKLLVKKYGSVNASLFQGCFTLVTSSHCSEAVAQDVENFFKSEFDECQQKVLHRIVGQSLESIRLNERFVRQNLNSLSEYLARIKNAC